MQLNELIFIGAGIIIVAGIVSVISARKKFKQDEDKYNFESLNRTHWEPPPPNIYKSQINHDKLLKKLNQPEIIMPSPHPRVMPPRIYVPSPQPVLKKKEHDWPAAPPPPPPPAIVRQNAEADEILNSVATAIVVESAIESIFDNDRNDDSSSGFDSFSDNSSSSDDFGGGGGDFGGGGSSGDW